MRLNKYNIIIEFVKKNIMMYNSFEHVYIFGSILRGKQNINDIDILIIYTKYTNELEEDLKLFLKKIERETNMIVDITLLSIEEQTDTKFLDRLRGNYLKIK